MSIAAALVPILFWVAGTPAGPAPPLDTLIDAAGPYRRPIVAEGSKHDIPERRPDTILDAVRSLMP
ncbi:MAG TPA: hypothetical protein VHR43_17720 [Gemmatimonadales bacterium]|jgi:hypothetical protein|nr:hypothetical protein [Gemmatimonadales bacterium]